MLHYSEQGCQPSLIFVLLEINPLTPPPTHKQKGFWFQETMSAHLPAFQIWGTFSATESTKTPPTTGSRILIHGCWSRHVDSHHTTFPFPSDHLGWQLTSRYFLTDKPCQSAPAHKHAYLNSRQKTRSVLFKNNSNVLWGCADQSVSLNSRGVAYFACLSGWSYPPPGERSVKW